MNDLWQKGWNLKKEAEQEAAQVALERGEWREKPL